MGLLDGKVAAITGAGGGIGRAHAVLFAREGARVVVNDIGGARDGTPHRARSADRGSGDDRAAQVAAEITAAGGQAVANRDDVATGEGARGIVAAAVDTFGKLDILVNNAGILRDKTLRKMDEAMWDAVVRVHLRGTFLCLQAAAQHMCDRNQGGRIINTTSVSGLMGNFGQANYSAAKAGIYGLTRTAAMELKKYSVTVNALAPVALTRMTEDLPMMKAMPDANDLLSPEHVAPAALFLASDLAADVTGQVLAVEGKRIYLYRMTQTHAATPADDSAWTAQEIAARWSEVASG